jgi:CheY-like chemotaxis protein
LEALQEIKANPALRRIPIMVLMTSQDKKTLWFLMI